MGWGYAMNEQQHGAEQSWLSFHSPRARTASASDVETCPSACVERNHPGREHDPERDGCYCQEMCAMGPTCPGAITQGMSGAGCERIEQPTEDATENDAAFLLAEESFRHSWDMSDERRINGVWVAGLCCECGAFVPYGEEVAHVAAALAPLLAASTQAAIDARLGEVEAEFAEMAEIWGGNRSWLTTGRKVSDLCVDIVHEARGDAR